MAPGPLDRGAVGLGLALRRLGVTARVLYVTAHPDDEHNGVLAQLSRGRGVRTRLFTLTRGEGGQNVLGPELGEALGVLRTEELLAVHRLDGAEQSFGRAYEFGYSFSVEESFERWGREETLGDVVREVRAFRPDVVLTLPLEGRAGGLHHQAAARLAAEAFRAAADPSRFPEQVRDGLSPWQALKIYQGGVGGSTPQDGEPAAVALGTAAYDALLGMSAQELGSRARARHRSQAVRQLFARPGEGGAAYRLVDSEPRVRWPESDILQGMDATLPGLVRFSATEAPQAAILADALSALQEELEQAQAGYDARAPGESAPPLAAALAHLRRLRDEQRDQGASPDLLSRLDDEERDLMHALALAHGLSLEGLTADPLVVPGQRVEVTAVLWNQGTRPVSVDALALRAPAGWAVETLEGTAGPVAAGGSVRVRYRVTVSDDARPSQPYWRRRPDRDRHALEVPACEGRPFCPPEVVVAARYRTGEVRAELEAPVWSRREAVAGGEEQVTLQVVPALSVHVEPAVIVAPRAAPRPRTVVVRVADNRPEPGRARVRLEVPAGWRTRPPDAPLAFGREGESASTRFTLVPPARPEAGTATVRAVATAGGRDFTQGAQVIAYPHVQERRWYEAADVAAVALDLGVRADAPVGYVMGTGDAVPAALEQLGVRVTALEPEDLASTDLSSFHTIVLGVRAYQARADLRAHHHRLMEWVRRGGHLVAQYQRLEFNLPGGAERPAGAEGQPDSPFAPYPAAVSLRRVTDEAAPVTVLRGQATLLTTPNRIGTSDWEGWVQERGTYFLDARDERYRELLSMRDPFPLNPDDHKGVLVEADVGRGTWTYVGLTLFRQLPAGVPGAYRLLANLVSRPGPRPRR